MKKILLILFLCYAVFGVTVYPPSIATNIYWSDSTAQQLDTAGTGLAHSFSLNGTLRDSTGSLAIENNGCTYGLGKIDSCLNFASGNQSLMLTVVPELDSVTSFTISFWAKFTEINKIYNIVRAYSASNKNLWIYFWASTGQTNVSINDVNHVFTTADYVIAGKWQHWDIVYNAGTLTIYIDGVVAMTASDYPARTSNLSNIGYRFGHTSNSLNGSIDEIKIFKSALTQAQVNVLYASKRRNFRLPFDTVSTGKVFIDTAFNHVSIDSVLFYRATGDTVKNKISTGLVADISSILRNEQRDTVYYQGCLAGSGRSQKTYFISYNFENIVHTNDIVYSSSIDAAVSTLYADISYKKHVKSPLLVVMHGFNDTKASITYDIRERLAGDSLFILIPSLRGRNSSNGIADASLRELYDVYDAVNYAKANYSAYIDTTNINIVGYSGGGGNALGMAAKFPYLFGLVIDHFGMSDYGYSATNGWWATNTSYQAGIAAMVGGNPSDTLNAYFARDALASRINRKGRTRIYHDSADNAVSIKHSRLYTGSNVVYSETNPDSVLRWIHGYPYHGYNLVNTELQWVPEIKAGTYKTNSQANKDTFFVTGYIKTDSFTVKLGNDFINACSLFYDFSGAVKKLTIDNRVTGKPCSVTVFYNGTKSYAVGNELYSITYGSNKNKNTGTYKNDPWYSRAFKTMAFWR